MWLLGASASEWTVREGHDQRADIYLPTVHGLTTFADLVESLIEKKQKKKPP